MQASLLELQRRFAAALDDPRDASVAAYRGAIASNYRRALGATYRVVRELVGDAFFAAAVDAFVREHPSTGGDLNVYGGAFASFLADYPFARELPYLPDVARLEWALDEAARAPSGEGSVAELVAALGLVSPEDLAHRGFVLAPSCRLVQSPFPVMRIWQAHHGQGAIEDVDLAAGPDRLLVRRDAEVPAIERLRDGDFAWLDALAAGASLEVALRHATGADPEFDLGRALGAHIASGAIARLA